MKKKKDSDGIINFSNLKSNDKKILSCVKTLKSDGYYKFEDLIQKDKLIQIKRKFDNLIKNNLKLFFYDIHPSIKDIPEKNEINSSNIHNFTNYIMLKNPVQYFPEIIELINDDLSKILFNYFGVIPSLTHVNLKRSFKNELPPMGTNFYHRDENGVNFLKAFIYLNDVNENNGPFVYIQKSHQNISIKDFYKYSYTEQEIEKKNTKDFKILATAKFGDIIFANTRGLHRGNKVTEGVRDMITLHFCLHYEYFKESSKLILPPNYIIPKNYKKAFFDHSNSIKN